jgi:hypothetical protein
VAYTYSRERTAFRALKRGWNVGESTRGIQGAVSSKSNVIAAGASSIHTDDGSAVETEKPHLPTDERFSQVARAARHSPNPFIHDLDTFFLAGEKTLHLCIGDYFEQDRRYHYREGENIKCVNMYKTGGSTRFGPLQGIYPRSADMVHS